METKKIKRPIAPAIFLSLSILLAIVLLLFNALKSGISIIGFVILLINSLLELPGNIRNTDVFNNLIYIAQYGSHLIFNLPGIVLRIFPLILCIILFLKKRNKLLVAATGAYILMPVGLLISYVLQWATDIIINVIRNIGYKIYGAVIIYSYHYYFSIFFAIVTSLLLYILFISAAVMMFIVSLSVLENPNKPSKIIKFLKFLFWLPALLYFFNFIFQEATTVTSLINSIISWTTEIIARLQHGDEIFNTLFRMLVAIIPFLITHPLSLIGSLCTLLFFLTYGLWLFNPYKKEKKFSKSIKKETVEENNLKEPQNINK